MCCFRERRHFNIILCRHIFRQNWVRVFFFLVGKIKTKMTSSISSLGNRSVLSWTCLVPGAVLSYLCLASCSWSRWRLWSLIRLWLCVPCILSLCILGLDWDCLFMCHFFAALQPVSKRYEEYFSLLNFMVLENVVRNVIIKWYFSTNCFWSVLWCRNLALYVYLLVDCRWRFFIMLVLKM